MANDTNQPKKRLPKRVPKVTPEQNKKQKTKRTLITASAIAAVIIIIIVIAVYFINVLPFQRTIIKVEDDSVTTGYFIKRVLNSSSDNTILGAINDITEEMIILQEAPKMGITVTDEEIDQALQEASQGSSDEPLSEAEFNEWFRQELNYTQLSSAEYRDIVRRDLYRTKLAMVLSAMVPESGEQIHLFAIEVATSEEAEALKTRFDEGEDFSALAREASLISTVAEDGGDLGWLPADILSDNFRYQAAALEVGECSDPINNSVWNDDYTELESQSYVLLYVSEKAADMEYQEDHITVLQSNALNDWMEEQMEEKTIKYYGLDGSGFDSETSAWIYYQVTRLAQGRE